MTKPRILVVDDEEDIRTVVRASLASRYEIVEAIDGLDALQKLDIVEPDFVILDVMMPLMDGLNACKGIRNNPKFFELPVLFLTALTSRDDIMKGYDVGANLYLTKPFEPSRLMRNVDAFFETERATFREKTYTIEEIEKIHREGASAIAAAHVGVADTGAMPHGRSDKPGSASAESVPRVLVVDGDTENLKRTKKLLSGNFDIFAASDGMEAINKITAYQPDIILLETVIPRMSGYQLCQSVRRNLRFAGTPIAFVSAKSSARDQEYALRIGGTAFLTKPFDDSQLVTLMGQLLARPDFKVYPKVLSAEQIRDKEWKEDEALRAKENAVVAKEETELEKFLREHARD